MTDVSLLKFKDLGKGDSVRLAVDKGGSYYVDLRKPVRDDDDDGDDDDDDSDD
jgi:hypothetical protein